MRDSKVAALSGLFAALTAVGAQLSLFIGPVPITLQTLFILLSGLVGGPRVGMFSQLIYLSLGLAGLPVFAGFRGGVQVFLGPTAGYLLSFPIAASTAGTLFTKTKSVKRAILAAAMAEAVIYLMGVPWLAVWFHVFGGVGLFDGFSEAVMMGALVFLPGDALKAAAAVYIATRKSVVRVFESVNPP